MLRKWEVANRRSSSVILTPQEKRAGLPVEQRHACILRRHNRKLSGLGSPTFDSTDSIRGNGAVASSRWICLVQSAKWLRQSSLCKHSRILAYSLCCPNAADRQG